MDIMNIAVELGKAIANSTELTEYRKLEQEVEDDDRARELFSEYRKLQADLAGAQYKGEPPETIEEYRKKLLAKYEEIETYDTTKRFLAAKARFDRLMKNINSVISFFVTGETSCSSGGCAGCSGCGSE